MATTKKDTAAEKKKLRDELNSLLSGSVVTADPFNSSDGGLNTDGLPDPMTIDRARAAAAPSVQIDVADLDSKFKKQARGVIESMYEFYYNMGVMEKPEYIEKKKNIDAMNMSNMLFQLKMTKHVIGRVLEEINQGNMNPKLIENYCTLNTQMTELTKSQANYMLFLEESVKKAKIETNDYNSTKSLNTRKNTIAIENPIEDVTLIDSENQTYAEPESNDEDTADKPEGKYFVTSDPTVLITEISNTDLSYEAVKSQRSDYLKERGNVSDLVDYSNKNDLVEKYNVDASTVKEDADSGDDSDLLSMI